MTNRQNIENSSLTEIPSSKRVYAFKDLPPDVQENLLRLQNSDGDFLRLINAVTAARVIRLVLLSVGFAFFAASFEMVSTDLKWVFVFSAGALIFLLGFIYLVRGFFKTIRSPIKNRIYLTTTQVIETTDGQARYRQLKDASEIILNRFWTDIGRRSSLDIKFADGDVYRYTMETNNKSAQLAETKKWHEKAIVWKESAIAAFERGDAAYFNSRDVFHK